jgi:alpha-1,3-glucan synthase
MLRACIVQGSQQIWVAALWYWGFQLQGSPQSSAPPWWIVLIVWPLAAISFLFAYLMLYGLPGKSSGSTLRIPDAHLHTEYYRQTPPKVPNFIKTLFRRKLVLWFLASEVLRDYWLSGVSIASCLSLSVFIVVYSHTAVTGHSSGLSQFPNGRSQC